MYFFFSEINSKLKFLYSLPIIAAVDLCFAAIASESAYTVTPELFLQADRASGTAIVTFVQVIIAKKKKGGEKAEEKIYNFTNILVFCCQN